MNGQGALPTGRIRAAMRAELLANLVEAIAMLDAPSGDDIRRLTRTKLSAVPVTEPGSGWGRNWSASGGSLPRSQSPAGRVARAGAASGDVSVR
jgi:hypothetical protein